MFRLSDVKVVARFNWATFTASLSNTPAATLVIRRVTLSVRLDGLVVDKAPIDKAPWVAFQVGSSDSEPK